MKNKELKVIAGPCSIDQDNEGEIYEIAKIKVNGERAIAGVRVVGIKSRTALDSSGNGMGIDYQVIMQNLKVQMNGGTNNDFEIAPSVEMAKKFAEATGMEVATELMIPSLQMPMYERELKNHRLMPWNAAVNQLGWQLMEIGEYAKKYDWNIGIKNAKWIGAEVDKADSQNYDGSTPLEQTWAGLTKYVGEIKGDTVLIHRGVDVPEKGNYRNLPVHNIASRVKQVTGAKLFFDPSHTHGPVMKEKIVPATIQAMNMKVDDETYLYDGILIEVGTSKTDTGQHITLVELEDMVNQIAEFRTLLS